MIYAIVALVVSSTCSLAQPYYFGLMINSSALGKGADTHKLDRYATVLVIVFFIGGVTTAVRGWLFTLIGERLVRNLRTQLFEKIVKQDVAFFDQNKTGELISRLSSDTVVVQSCLSVNISQGLRSVAQVVVSIILLFLTSWSLTLVMLAVVPVLVIVAVAWGRYTKGLTKDYQDALAHAADIGSETIGNARIVKAFGSEELEIQNYRRGVYQAYSKGAKKAAYYGMFFGVLMFLSNAAILLVIYYGALLVIHGHMTVGDLTAFVLYSIYITIGLASCTDLYSELMNALGASERYAYAMARELAVHLFAL
jgi:ABC-type multidrug transport system fused ATPase/permease subunit